MSARTKINAFKIQGAILIAGLAGWVFQSWLVFLIVVAVLIATGIHSGEIRAEPWRK